ncbi:MAG TPA: hypothetical protein VHS59_06135 [Bacillota bacterium]|nr:hypothetical protein [Bacillota bacterium]
MALIILYLTTFLCLEVTASTDEETSFSPGEIENAWEDYHTRSIEDERGLEIEELDKLLIVYGIQFEDLPDIAPRHRETRANLIKAAKGLAEQEQLMEKFLSRRSLPVKELSLVTGVTPKTIEKGRKYIITITLILYYYQEFSCLRSYITD